MCPQFALFFAFLLFLLASMSPTVSSQLHEEAPSSDCPSCALSQMRRNSSSSGAQSEMLEAVKRHILNMLHLNARPNLTQTIPRAALHNAIKQLHFGHISEDGSVEIQEESPSPEDPVPPEPPSEIIAFGEPGDSPNTVKFDVAKEDDGPALVEQANVWIFLVKSKLSRGKAKVMLRLLKPSHDECVSEKMVDTRRSGWHMLAVPQTVQSVLNDGSRSLRLRVSCPLCAEAGVVPILTSAERLRDQSHRPFLMVMLRPEEEKPQRVKRGLECDGKINVCCKRQFYVNFKDIGWNDWIIAPSGYHANYCEGNCPNHMATLGGSALSFHSAVINHYRMRGYSPFQNTKSCCVPLRLRAMSMLYYNEEQNIIKKDVQNMIVDECGCS